MDKADECNTRVQIFCCALKSLQVARMEIHRKYNEKNVIFELFTRFNGFIFNELCRVKFCFVQTENLRIQVALK